MNDTDQRLAELERRLADTERRLAAIEAREAERLAHLRLIANAPVQQS